MTAASRAGGGPPARGRSRAGRAPLGPSPPPHVDRLVERVLSLDGPVIQIWAWPGSGQQAILDALTDDARFGQPLSFDDLADPAAARRTVEAAFAGGAHSLVLPAMPSLAAVPAPALDAIGRLLSPGKRLVYSSPSRQSAGPLTASFLLPEELLLTRDEITLLWREVAGGSPGPDLVDRLAQFTDGWYRPLRLAAEAAAGAAGSVDPETLVELPAVAAFLRQEVLALLAAEERELLLTLSAGRSLDPELWRDVLDPAEEQLRRRLVDDRGLVVEDEGSIRLPYLLRWFLSRERRARWPPRRRQQLAARLSTTELELERPVSALEQFSEAGETAALADLLDRQWPKLMAEAPLGLVARLDERRGQLPRGSGAAFLARITRALLAGQPPQTGPRATDPGLAAVEPLVAELLGNAGTGSSAGREADLPVEVRPLDGLVAAQRRAADATAAGEAEDADPAIAARLVAALVAVDPGTRPRRGPAGLHSLTPLQALAERTVADLLWRRPGLAEALAEHHDLPQAWRRWLGSRQSLAPAAEGPGYVVQLLGHPTVRLRDAEGHGVELRFPLRRAFEVFAFLATSAGFEASRDELVDAVWGDSSEAAVARNFHPTLSHLRRTLGPADAEVSPVIRRGSAYRLNPRLAWTVDAVELVRGVDEGRRRLAEGQPELAAEAWSASWRLYRGPLLAAWDAPWVVERRDEVQRRYVGMLRGLGEVRERLGQLGEAVDALRAALVADPLQERTHQALMRLYARQGRRDHVRRQYERLAAALGSELEVEPSEETAALYQRLMS
ncbi:MAG TPA: BTAD domain-containing putative transcriptional regulator [Thermoanaerobaculia bacterium]|nr:BTAD domain-containing putative transcriptional regulator [Thermoanaerobaculia bacterium]